MRPRAGDPDDLTRREAIRNRDQIMRLHRSYSDVLMESEAGSHEHMPEDLRVILADTVMNWSTDVMTSAGSIAVEAAVKLTDDPREKTELLDFAKNSWGYVVSAAKLSRRLDDAFFRSLLGLSTLESVSSLAYNDELPDRETQLSTYGQLVGVASKSLMVGRKLARGHQRLNRRSQRIELSGFQAELGVLLLLQRFHLAAEGVGQIALPAFYSEDHGLVDDPDVIKTNKWDVSIYQSEDGEVNVPVKIQVKTRENANGTREADYADDIVVVRLAEDVGPNIPDRHFAPGHLLRKIVLEKQKADANDPSLYGPPFIECDDRDNIEAIDAMTARLFDRIDDSQLAI